VRGNTLAIHTSIFKYWLQNTVYVPKTKANEKMVLISVHIPRQLLEELDELVKRGVFPSRSEAIRIAIRDLLLRYYEMRALKEGSATDFVLIPGSR